MYFVPPAGRKVQSGILSLHADAGFISNQGEIGRVKNNRNLTLGFGGRDQFVHLNASVVVETKSLVVFREVKKVQT
jgi:hypothetical protein